MRIVAEQRWTQHQDPNHDGVPSTHLTSNTRIIISLMTSKNKYPSRVEIKEAKEYTLYLGQKRKLLGDRGD